MFKVDVEPRWDILAPGRLLLVGTHLVIDYEDDSIAVYHVHWLRANGDVRQCFGGASILGATKEMVLQTVNDLMEMGMEP